MVGLHNHSNARTLKQWGNLFKAEPSTCSIHACEHWKHVERLGIPSSQNRTWKYTPLEDMLSRSFDVANNKPVSSYLVSSLRLAIDSYQLVFINGQYSKELSNTDTGKWNIVIEHGAERQTLPSPIQSEVFLHLTESLSHETTRIRLPDRELEDKPLYLMHISQGSADEKTISMLHYRHHIEVGIGAKGQVIEHFISLDLQSHFSGSRTTIYVDDNAYFSHIKLATENKNSYHFAHNDVVIGQDAIMRSSCFVLGSKLTKNHISAQLNGEGSDIAINSILLPSDNNTIDNSTYLEHNKGYCKSRQLHKIIACNHSRGVFNGLLKVAKNSLKTDGKMINNNLLLNKTAKINTKPQMEIYADDVRCSHGATIGMIDGEQILYLRSRGIGMQDAKQMLVYAFAMSATDIIDNNALRKIVLSLISTSLKELT